MTRHIGLTEYFWLAEQVTGVDTATLVKASRVDLADSALHAPAAGFGDEDFHPDLYDKAAVLCCRLSWNARVDGDFDDLHATRQRIIDTSAWVEFPGTPAGWCASARATTLPTRPARRPPPRCTARAESNGRRRPSRRHCRRATVAGAG